jgi:hypothetical protein
MTTSTIVPITHSSQPGIVACQSNGPLTLANTMG